MPKQKTKKSIANTLMAVMLIVIAALIVFALYYSSEKNSESNMSSPYRAVDISSKYSDTADGFTYDIVVSRGYVEAGDFALSSGSERALLFDVENNEAIFAQGIYQKAYPASLTKIMTAILAIEYGNMDDTVVMDASDFELEEGSQVSNLQVGDSVTMQQLFDLTVIYSANDAANAIARHISGSVEKFVDLMNEEALLLGMLGTNFTNVHGLHDDAHYTCAYDVYLMMNKAMEYPLFTQTIRNSSYTLEVTRGDSVIQYYYESTDEFLTGIESEPAGVNIWGGKTGTTSQAGACLALIVQNEQGVPYIAVIMNADKKTILYEDMRSLLSLAL